MGYSDVTALLLAFTSRTGLVTFYGPVGISTWNEYSVKYVQEILMNGKAVTLRNLSGEPVNAITPSRSRGQLMGGGGPIGAGRNRCRAAKAVNRLTRNTSFHFKKC